MKVVWKGSDGLPFSVWSVVMTEDRAVNGSPLPVNSVSVVTFEGMPNVHKTPVSEQ
jgi:hypothetical protein